MENLHAEIRRQIQESDTVFKKRLRGVASEKLCHGSSEELMRARKRVASLSGAYQVLTYIVFVAACLLLVLKYLVLSLHIGQDRFLLLCLFLAIFTLFKHLRMSQLLCHLDRKIGLLRLLQQIDSETH
jgi:hypothetical protein